MFALAGLPPAYINTGALDLFLEEDIAYAAALARVGVPVELHCYRGAYHGYEFNADASVVRKSVGDAIAALGKAFSTPAYSKYLACKFKGDQRAAEAIR